MNSEAMRIGMRWGAGAGGGWRRYHLGKYKYPLCAVVVEKCGDMVWLPEATPHEFLKTPGRPNWFLSTAPHVIGWKNEGMFG